MNFPAEGHPRARNGGVGGCLGSVADAEELYLSNAARVHVLHALAPLHKGNLDVIVALNRDEITILVTIPQFEHSLADAAIGKPRELGIDAVDQGLVRNVERYHESNIVAGLAVDSHLELSGQG